MNSKIIDILENPDKYSKTPVFAGQQVHYQQDQYNKKNRLSPSKKTGHTHMWYKKDEKPPAPTVINKAAPAPKPAVPKEQSLKIEPVKASPEIKQAKSRVNAYENNQSSAWDEAQSTVQSSFIKSSDSSTNSQQYDFSSKSFNASESPEPNEQAQAAQDKVQNYISKYSKYKSNN